LPLFLEAAAAAAWTNNTGEAAMYICDSSAISICFIHSVKPRRIGRTDPTYSVEAEDTEMVDSMMIDVATLRAATGDFDESNKLGAGGFGAVYKVVILTDKQASMNVL
jgi:hypothetical protein